MTRRHPAPRDPAGWVAEWVELGAVGCSDAEAWDRLERFVDTAVGRSRRPTLG